VFDYGAKRPFVSARWRVQVRVRRGYKETGEVCLGVYEAGQDETRLGRRWSEGAETDVEVDELVIGGEEGEAKAFAGVLMPSVRRVHGGVWQGHSGRGQGMDGIAKACQGGRGH
jgi:hypothetical protein